MGRYLPGHFLEKSHRNLSLFSTIAFSWPDGHFSASIASSVLYVVPLGNCAFAKIKPTAVGM